MAAYGLYSHIQSNRRRSIALLIGLFFLVYVLVYAGALVAEALSIDADINTLMQRALSDLISAAPLATLGTALWVVIAVIPVNLANKSFIVPAKRNPSRDPSSVLSIWGEAGAPASAITTACGYGSLLSRG